MSVLINLPGRRKLYVEYAGWARPDTWFARSVDRGEVILWFGRWHVIYTPAGWTPRRRCLGDAEGRTVHG